MASGAKPKHDFHLVDPSPRPIITTISIFMLALGGLNFMHGTAIGKPLLIVGLLAVFASAYYWWRDVVKEGIKDHAHNSTVRTGLRIGMLLFIVSEVMFFFAFFFSFFKSVLMTPGLLDGVWVTAPGVWPPKGITTLDPWQWPFMNTLILLLSGTTVTWAHHALMHGDKKSTEKGLLLTVLLGVTFTLLQAYEYSHATFPFKNGGIYASNFYMATGFHGFHVLVGTIFLFICYLRARKDQFTKTNHLGFEFAAWYWHFVDVVWLFLFVVVYWWGGA